MAGLPLGRQELQSVEDEEEGPSGGGRWRETLAEPIKKFLANNSSFLHLEEHIHKAISNNSSSADGVPTSVSSFPVPQDVAEGRAERCRSCGGGSGQSFPWIYSVLTRGSELPISAT